MLRFDMENSWWSVRRNEKANSVQRSTRLHAALFGQRCVGEAEPFPRRGRRDSGVDGSYGINQGVQDVVSDAGRACLGDSVPRTDLATPRQSDGEPNQVLFPVRQ